MQCSILQPGYLPWLGFFDQLERVDLFIIYDDVQFTRRDWRSRNRIKTHSGVKWLTVPVKNKGKRDQLIYDVEIDYCQDWAHKHTEQLRHAYAKAPWFMNYIDTLCELLNKPYCRLLDLDMALINYLNECFSISTESVFASKLAVKGSKTERLANLCIEVGATSYLTGDAASSYLDKSLFNEHHIEVQYHGYHHQIYPQLHGTFEAYLSAIDLLFNCGPESLDYITGRRS